ncbi:hypothetical protein EV361DRAFT_930938 [Lentinula raphanica]|nr:hypothetical protein EV361DRAFT_930938 [Lentinula raphanica]
MIAATRTTVDDDYGLQCEWTMAAAAVSKLKSCKRSSYHRHVNASRLVEMTMGFLPTAQIMSCRLISGCFPSPLSFFSTKNCYRLACRLQLTKSKYRNSKCVFSSSLVRQLSCCHAYIDSPEPQTQSLRVLTGSVFHHFCVRCSTLDSCYIVTFLSQLVYLLLAIVLVYYVVLHCPN